ncbi:MAG TPA: hypothetical protein VJL29_14440 [Thermoguttaceae bacterium]|nr:hypothetical protein [Thermoguttaceae bacterium]
MIATDVIDAIRELLAEGRMSRRRIARTLGVSRGVVAGVAEGRRPDYDAMRRRREENTQPLALGPLRRCPTCGGMVHVPCRLCALREQLLETARNTARRMPDLRLTEPLGLELHGEARSRYEAIHSRRMQQGELCVEDEGDLAEDAADWTDATDDPADWPEDDEGCL